MNIVTQHVFPVSPQELWDLLLNSARLARCIPGCEKLEEVELDRYTATLKIGVAAIKGTYSGKVEITEKQPPSHYKLAIEGTAGPGFVRGTARMDLSAAGDGSSLLAVNAEAEVGGLLASVGQRFLGGITMQMIQRFFRNIEEQSRLARSSGAAELTGEVAH